MEKSIKAAATKRRAKGEQTRSNILDATLRVIASQGLRSVTHRAVAKEAAVQLSLTTYYFRDIKDLISEAFVRYTQRGRPELERLWQQVDTLLDSVPPTRRRTLEGRQYLADGLAALAFEFIAQQIRDHGDNLLIEQMFFAEISLGPEIKVQVEAHRQALYQPLVQLCGTFNRNDPELDAEILLRTILSVEYEAVGKPFDEAAQLRLHRLLGRLMGWLLGLRQH